MPDPEYTYRGAWATATAYLANDLVDSEGVAYVCTDAHTSDAGNGPPSAEYWDPLITSDAATAYATVAEYRAGVGKDSDDDDTQIQVALNAVSRYIDWKLVRPLGFNKDATNTARVYEMERGTKLDIDDHVSVASVEIGDRYTGVYDSALSASAYTLLPRNAASAPEPFPYRAIEFLTTIPGPGQLVRVTGIGGWNAVPPAIKSACIELTGILRLESPRARNRITEMNQVLATSRAAQDILSGLLVQYRLKRTLI